MVGAGNQARQTYDEHAPSYEEFLRDYQYERWTTKLLERAEQAGLGGRRLLDVGCGTGLSFVVPLSRGFEVTACDVSPRMVEIARRKFDDQAHLLVADMRELPRLDDFDLIWSVNDALNYLLSPTEFDAALAGMARNLSPRGVLLFDLNTLAGLESLFCGTRRLESGRRSMTWTGLMQRGEISPGSICEARYVVEGMESIATTHRERHFPHGEVLDALARAGLRPLEVLGEVDGELSLPLDEHRHTKAVYVAQIPLKD